MTTNTAPAPNTQQGDTVNTAPTLAAVIDQIKINVVCAEAIRSTQHGRRALRLIEGYEQMGVINRESLTGVLRSMAVELPSVRARREGIEGYDLCIRYLPTATD